MSTPPASAEVRQLATCRCGALPSAAHRCPLCLARRAFHGALGLGLTLLAIHLLALRFPEALPWLGLEGLLASLLFFAALIPLSYFGGAWARARAHRQSERRLAEHLETLGFRVQRLLLEPQLNAGIATESETGRLVLIHRSSEGLVLRGVPASVHAYAHSRWESALRKVGQYRHVTWYRAFYLEVEFYDSDYPLHRLNLLGRRGAAEESGEVSRARRLAEEWTAAFQAIRSEERARRSAREEAERQARLARQKEELEEEATRRRERWGQLGTPSG